VQSIEGDRNTIRIVSDHADGLNQLSAVGTRPNATAIFRRLSVINTLNMRMLSLSGNMEAHELQGIGALLARMGFVELELNSWGWHNMELNLLDFLKV
jgi:hypothetical protein